MKGGAGQHPKKKVASEEVPGRPGWGGVSLGTGCPLGQTGPHVQWSPVSSVMNPPLLSRTVRKTPGLTFPRG